MYRILPELPDHLRKAITSKRDLLFVYAYAKNGGNIAQAAISAGYTAQTADKIAPRWLSDRGDSRFKPAVHAAVTWLMQRELERTRKTSEDIFREMSLLGFSNIADYFEPGEDGTPVLRAWDEITRDQLAAVQQVTVRERRIKASGDYATADELHDLGLGTIDSNDENTGNREIVERFVTLKLYDKRASLETLGKAFAMWVDKQINLNLQAVFVAHREMTDEELQNAALARMRELRAGNTGNADK